VTGDVGFGKTMEFDNGSLIVGRWDGAPIKIHWSVLLCAFFFGRFQFLPIYWTCFFIVVLIHEAGHVLVIRRFKLWVDEIVIHGIGGYCRWGGNAGEIPRALIAWGGVLAQLALLIVAYSTFSIIGAFHSVVTQQIYRAFVISNIWMICFNLLPIEPLDGVRAWKLLGLLRDDFNIYMSERKRKKQNETLKRQLEAIMNQGPDEDE